MSYNTHQDLPPFYSNGLGINTSSSNHSGSSSPPPSSSVRQQHQIHPYHQQMPLKSSPESLSPMSSSSSSSSASSSSYQNNISSSPMATSFAAALFKSGEDIDMQPLDLSLRPGRDEPNANKRPKVMEHKPVCLVRSCVCNLGNTRSQRLSPYPILTQGASRSPNLRMTSSPLGRTDSPFFIQRRTPSPAYYNGIGSTSGVSSVYHMPPPPTAATTATDGSAFQLLTTSDNVLNGHPNPSGLFRPYDESIDSDINNLNPNSNGDDSSPPPSRQQHQQQQQQQEEEEEPTYMDLDSASQKSQYNSANREYSINRSPSRYTNQSMSHMAPVHSRESKVGNLSSSAPSQPQPPNLHHPSSSSSSGCDGIQIKKSTYYIGGTTSETSSAGNKIQNFQNGIHYTSSSNVSTSSELGDQQPHHPSQLYHSDHSSPTSSVSSSTGHVTTLNSLYPDNPQPTGYPYPSSAPLDHSAASDARFTAVPLSEQQHQQESQDSSNSRMCPSSRASPSNKENKNILSENISKTLVSPAVTSTANYFQLPATTTTTSNPNGIVGHKHRRNGEVKNSTSLRRSSLDNENNEDSTKISLLDFMISKILMERDVETIPQSKPCNVDYIHTSNGDRKIRLRLVDLIELQVEQSLKA